MITGSIIPGPVTDLARRTEKDVESVEQSTISARLLTAYDHLLEQIKSSKVGKQKAHVASNIDEFSLFFGMA